MAPRWDGLAPVTAHNRSEWSRMARGAYSAGHNETGHRFSAAAATAPTRMPQPQFDCLMSEYRAWLVFNEWPK